MRKPIPAGCRRSDSASHSDGHASCPDIRSSHRLRPGGRPRGPPCGAGVRPGEPSGGSGAGSGGSAPCFARSRSKPAAQIRQISAKRCSTVVGTARLRIRARSVGVVMAGVSRVTRIQALPGAPVQPPYRPYIRHRSMTRRGMPRGPAPARSHHAGCRRDDAGMAGTPPPPVRRDHCPAQRRPGPCATGCANEASPAS